MTAGHGLVARFECLSRAGGMLGPVEQVRVDLQGDARVGVAELTADVDEVQAFGDQERCEAVPE